MLVQALNSIPFLSFATRCWFASGNIILCKLLQALYVSLISTFEFKHMAVNNTNSNNNNNKHRAVNATPNC